MAARSTRFVFYNDSDTTLVRIGGGLDHGIWTRQPPLTIPPLTNANWESESNGVLTGTEGHVDYDIQLATGGSAGTCHIYWDNPYVGSNEYEEKTPETFQVKRLGGGGDNAVVRLTFSSSSSARDGIPDEWKKKGVTLDPGDGSGPQFIDLPAMGADVNRPDVFVQLDWMADATHSHALSAAAIKTVVDAFAASPYRSPTGSVGINLHIDAGPNSIMNHATGATWGALSRARQLSHVANFGTAMVDASNNATSYNWTAFDAVKKQSGGFISTGRAPIFRYAISAHQLGVAVNSGIARTIPGSDMILTLGTFAALTDLIMAGTLMHELGHLLGLDHGGGDAVNRKPNYVSVMNYHWQTRGLTKGGVTGIVDFSNIALDRLFEGALDERSGVGKNAAGVAIRRWVPGAAGAAGAYVQVADGSLPIDWNNDGVATSPSVAFDVNNDVQQTALEPFDDWAEHEEHEHEEHEHEEHEHEEHEHETESAAEPVFAMPNTMVFERLIARSRPGALLGVRQAVSIDRGSARRTVRARFDVLDDLSLIQRDQGETPCAEQAASSPTSDQRGLVLVQVVTLRGGLTLEETVQP